MARCSVTGRTVTTTPDADQGPSLYATAASGALILREVGIFNTTVTAFCVGLLRATTAGTQGTALVEENIDDVSHTILGTGFNVHSVAPTVTAGAEVRRGSVGAAIGSGVIWTFSGRGLEIAEGTANGVLINVPTGTGQHFDFYFEWEE
jgi:hypothetical protein